MMDEIAAKRSALQSGKLPADSRHEAFRVVAVGNPAAEAAVDRQVFPLRTLDKWFRVEQKHTRIWNTKPDVEEPSAALDLSAVRMLAGQVTVAWTLVVWSIEPSPDIGMLNSHHFSSSIPRGVQPCRQNKPLQGHQVE
jgi:hypothetical protein